jgi:menaquinone-dependent protoporphyrinogen oxidase
MKTLIVYASAHGTTEKVAHSIARSMDNGHVEIINLKKENPFDLSVYDRIIVGGSIHAGQIQGRVKQFCEKNMLQLLEKQLGLFLCCMNEPEYQAQFERAFPELLRKHASSSKIMGGEFLFDKMNFFQRLIVRKISGINESVSKIDEKSLQQFAEEMNAVKLN